MNVPDWLTSLAQLFLLPLVVSAVLTALLIRLAPRWGLVDYPSQRKVHTRPTPRGGGLSIFLTAIGFRFSAVGWQTVLAVVIVLLGLLDDWRPQRWQVRLCVPFGVALVAVLLCLPPQPWLVLAAAVVWIAAMINAFNMLDNMDALSGGVAGIAAAFLAFLAWLTATPADSEWTSFIVLLGALLGFLWFNRPPARIFMGDAGSTFLGFTLGLGSLQVVPHSAERPWSWLALPCLLAVPCYDLLSVVLLRLSQGRSPFQADKQHLSHRLAGRGLSKETAVGTIYVMALASGTSAVLLYAVTTWMAAVLAAGQLAVWWSVLALIEFAAAPPTTPLKEPCHDTQAQNPPNAGV